MANENIPDLMHGLPMDQLISAPLRAACDSQVQLAESAYQYMTKIGFHEEGGGTKKPNIIEFNLQRPVETADGISVSEITVQAPFLGLVPIPSLLIDDVNIEFQMEVNATTSVKETQASEVGGKASTDIKLGFFGSAHVEVHGKVTTSRDNTRSTNQTAKYQVRVSAKQQQPTEGLSKLMDILATCIAPMSVKAATTTPTTPTAPTGQTG